MTTPDVHTHDQFLVKCSCGWSLASQSDGPDQRRYGPEPTPSQPEPLDARTIAAAINDATHLVNPRLSEVDWDAVAARLTETPQ